MGVHCTAGVKAWLRQRDHLLFGQEESAAGSVLTREITGHQSFTCPDLAANPSLGPPSRINGQSAIRRQKGTKPV